MYTPPSLEVVFSVWRSQAGNSISNHTNCILGLWKVRIAALSGKGSINNSPIKPPSRNYSTCSNQQRTVQTCQWEKQTPSSTHTLPHACQRAAQLRPNFRNHQLCTTSRKMTNNIFTCRLNRERRAHSANPERPGELPVRHNLAFDDNRPHKSQRASLPESMELHRPTPIITDKPNFTT